MRTLIVALLIVALPSSALAQPNAAKHAAGPSATHLVMITRAGPNFAKARDHRADARAHQAIFERLAAYGITIAGGNFEGEPIMGMTIWREGIDETMARQFMRDDQLPKLGIVDYEFRTFVVRTGSLEK